MKKRLAVVLLAGSLVGAACTKSDGSGNPSPAELSAALLTVTDMPTGWSESQRQVFDERGNENPSIDPSVWCSAAADESKDLVALAGESGADVEMQWSGGKGPRMMRLQAWSNADAEEYLAAVRASAGACDGVSATDADGVTVETSVIVGRSIGDESVSWSERTTPPAATQKDKLEAVGRTTVARFGNVVMVLQLGDAAPAGTGTLMPEDDWWTVVQLAANKLKKASD